MLTKIVSRTYEGVSALIPDAQLYNLFINMGPSIGMNPCRVDFRLLQPKKVRKGKQVVHDDPTQHTGWSKIVIPKDQKPKKSKWGKKDVVFIQPDWIKEVLVYNPHLLKHIPEYIYVGKLEDPKANTMTVLYEKQGSEKNLLWVNYYCDDGKSVVWMPTSVDYKPAPPDLPAL